MNEYGTDPHKLHRTDAIDTSVDAAHAVDSATWEKRMHEFIQRAGKTGATPKDALLKYPNAPYSTITARFAALKQRGLVVDSGTRVNRSAVLIATEFIGATNEQT
jgi:hypothetical protein